MNILKIGFLLLTGLGFGFGVDTLANEMNNDSNQKYSDAQFEERYCHQQDSFFEHMLRGLSTEDQALVQNKIDEMIVEYDQSLESILSDFDLRYDFMEELMEYLEDNDIDYHNHEQQDYWHHGMGLR